MWHRTLLAFALIGCTGDKGATGDPGGTGSDGTNTLVRVVAEAPGAHCPLGGSAILTGADTNHDGTLDDNEVTGTTYVCSQGPLSGAVLEGDYTARNSYELAIIHDVTKITGTLSIYSDAITTVELPNLTEIDGMLIISGNSPTSFSSLDFSNLVTIVQGLSLSGTHVPTLASAFPALAHIPNGVLDLIGNNFQGTLDFSHVDGVIGELELVTDTATGFDISGPDLSLCGDITINGNSNLVSITGLDEVQGVNGATYIFDSNAVLTSLHLHSLTAAYKLSVHFDIALATIDLSSLDVVVNSFVFLGSSLIKKCTLDAIVAGFSQTPITLQYNGNSDPCS